MSARPQTQSWLLKTCRLIADGIPQTITAAVTSVTARLRAMPPSMRMRVASSIIAMSDESAAKKSARKNRTRNPPPPGMRAKSCGIQTNISPSLPAAMAAIASFDGSSEKATGTTAIPASSDAELSPKPIVVEFSTVSSCFRM